MPGLAFTTVLVSEAMVLVSPFAPVASAVGVSGAFVLLLQAPTNIVALRRSIRNVIVFLLGLMNYG
jgi:hypothetical protein